jgi:hypothetical protein
MGIVQIDNATLVGQERILAVRQQSAGHHPGR